MLNDHAHVERGRARSPGCAAALALARDYATKRVAFGAPLADKPLHVDTLARLAGRVRGRVPPRVPRRRAARPGRGAATLTEEEARSSACSRRSRSSRPASRRVAVASEALEAFGGAGYVEDTGLPRLLRDAQVLPIWEGTTNVLSLDVLRALSRGGSLEPLARELSRCAQNSKDATLREAASVATRAFEHAGTWVATHAGDKTIVEAGARRFALTLGRSIELALLCEHAQWALDHEQDARFAAAARLFAKTPIDLIQDVALDDARALLG